METLNPFKKFDDLGIHPEIKRFGNPERSRALYEFELYVDGHKHTVNLRRGADSNGETREEATERIIERTEFILKFVEQHSLGLLTNKSFWDGFAYYEHYENVKESTQEFICGQQLRKEYKEVFGNF